MSGKSSGKKTVARRVTDAVGLAVVAAILFCGVRFGPPIDSDIARHAALLLAVGFLLLAGTLTSSLIEVLGVPHLTGYLLAGIIAGPHVLHLIDDGSAKRLEVVNTLAIALIALAGGAELRLTTLREGLKTLLSALSLQTVVVLFCTAGVFALVPPSFVQRMPPLAIFGVALLWGVVATTRSPSALLAVLSQTRAHGPLARFSLAFIMASDVVVVVSLAIVVTIARPLIDADAKMSLDALQVLGHELLGSIAMGTTIGLALTLYVKLIGRQLLIVLLAIGYGATELLRYVHFEPLLTFIVAGFIVQNMSKQGEKFLHAIESTGEVVYVLFFAAAGADLNIPLLRELWPSALLFTAVRAFSTYLANAASTRFAKDNATLKRWGWSALVSQAGVAIGIAHAVARQFPTFGPAFRDIAIACVAINEIVGPVLFKLALDRSGESRPPTSLEEVEETIAHQSP